MSADLLVDELMKVMKWSSRSLYACLYETKELSMVGVAIGLGGGGIDW